MMASDQPESGGAPPPEGQPAEKLLPTTVRPSDSKPRLIFAMEPEQHRTLKIYAAEHSVSMAVVMRGVIESFFLRADWQREVLRRIQAPAR